MNWNDVRIFLSVARHGQVLGAARGLGLNHATVARRLDALEAALATRLVVRKTTGCELTEAGRHFLLHAERMESEMLAAYGNARADSGVISGSVRVGAPDGFGVAFLAPRVGELSRHYPGLTVELVAVPRTFSLSRREADIAITIGRPGKGKLMARKLTDYTLGLYASEDYVREHGVPASLDELPKHRLVGYVEDLLYSSALDYTTEFHKSWRSTIAVSTAIGQFEVVRSGAGIGILHTFIARSDPKLVALLPQHTLTRSYWALVHEDLRPSRHIMVVAEFLSRIVAQNRAAFI
jgi:DNA-binding transcriptional LysR family regulator